MQNVRIFTNEVAGGWYAHNLDQFLGGSEECVVLLAEALSRSGYNVYVYHTFPKELNQSKYVKAGDGFEVKYAPRENVHVQAGDILITFKDRMPWAFRQEKSKAVVRIHWSSEVERPWEAHHLKNIHAFVCLSDFHASRMVFVPTEKKIVFPHGVDKKSLAANQCAKIPNTILYCSSPDRGLAQLLADWPQIRNVHPKMTLRVTYGFRNLKYMSHTAQSTIRMLTPLLEQEGVHYLGELSKKQMEEEYHMAQYWILPLLHAESELFCLNAVKSRLCECIPIINRIGALQDTVGNYIPYSAFKTGSMALEDSVAMFESNLDWDAIVDSCWVPLFEQILTKGHIV